MVPCFPFSRMFAQDLKGKGFNASNMTAHVATPPHPTPPPFFLERWTSRCRCSCSCCPGPTSTRPTASQCAPAARTAACWAPRPNLAVPEPGNTQGAPRVPCGEEIRKPRVECFKHRRTPRESKGSSFSRVSALSFQAPTQE